MKILKDCFPQDLHFIFKNIEKIDLAHSIVHKYLPAELQPYCKVINLRQSILVIEVTDGVWASQLRYQLPDLLNILRKETMLCGLIKIEIIVRK